MNVELLDCMGDDLTVVNAARVSYANHKSAFDATDRRLLSYLVRNGHWSPFAHPQLSFRVAASIACARQLFRHQVGLAVNEMSRRYVNTPPAYDLPDVWRQAPAPGQSKQGSGGAFTDQEAAEKIATDAIGICDAAYNQLVALGVAPEQARLVLPMATLTEWIWTGSLYAYIRVCQQRLADDAQAETRGVATLIYEHICLQFPESMAAWGLA